MKKLITLIVVLFLTLSASAQYNPGGVPVPPGGPGGHHPGADRSDHRQGPVGTATALMLGMSGVYAGYKVRKNKREVE